MPMSAPARRYYPKLSGLHPFHGGGGAAVTARVCSHRPESPRTDPHSADFGSARPAPPDRASSIHATFLREDDFNAFAGDDFLTRIDRKFHWFDNAYGDFEVFLAKPRLPQKRKHPARARRLPLAHDIHRECSTGADLSEAHLDAFHRLHRIPARGNGAPPIVNPGILLG